MSEELAPLYHSYGKALLYSSQDDLTELVSQLRENIKEIFTSQLPNEKKEGNIPFRKQIHI